MKNRIGLVLGGGGTKGAYQVGVLLALSKHKLLQQLEVVSSTSIGSINQLLIHCDNLEFGIDLWRNLARDDLLKRKKLTKILTGIKNFSLYSREGLLAVLEEYVDFELVKNSPITSYVTATRVIKNHNIPTYFKLNGASKEQIIQYVLASSAIPLIYEPIMIDGQKYVDGGKTDNEPFAPLLNHQLDLVILVPLNTNYKIPDAISSKATVLDLGSKIFENLKLTEGIKLDASTTKMRLETGFTITDNLIKSLRKKSIIVVTRKEAIIYWIKKLFRKLPERKSIYYGDSNRHK